MYSSLDVGKVKNDIWLLPACIYLEVVFSCVQVS